MIREFVRENRRLVIVGVITLATMAASGVVVTRALSGAAPTVEEDRPKSAEVSRVYDGGSAKLNDGDKVLYAGIRAPFADEPLFEEARRRNSELVSGREIQLRFDAAERDKKQRLTAYVFVDREFVNETLVREGLAWVRLTPQTQRFAERLLEAQRLAREARLGIWQSDPQNPEQSYIGDVRYGNYHRTSCPELSKIKPDRQRPLPTAQDAANAGFAPCPQCRPR